MQINPSYKNFKTAQLKNDSLKLKKERDKKKLRKVCNEFTAFFVKQMISAMRKTVPKDKLINGGQAEEIFRDMLDYEYAKNMTNSNQLKLARQLYESLSKTI